MLQFSKLLKNHESSLKTRWNSGKLNYQIKSTLQSMCKLLYTVVAKIIITLVFSAAKNGFKSVISVFYCSVSVGNISLHFQTLILPLIVIIQWYFCLTTASAPHRDLISSSSSNIRCISFLVAMHSCIILHVV